MKNLRSKTVFVIDPEPVARFGLVQLLQGCSQLQICGNCGDVRIGREVCSREQPDVVILDVTVGSGEGFALISELPRWSPSTGVVVFTRLEDPISFQRALKAGARGYVTKHDPTCSIVEAAIAISDGHRWLSPRMQDKIMMHFHQGAVEVHGDLLSHLSDRERQIFGLLGIGRSTREIANELCVSAKTVETHQARIREKLRVKHLGELRRQAAIFSSEGTEQP